MGRRGGSCASGSPGSSSACASPRASCSAWPSSEEEDVPGPHSSCEVPNCPAVSAASRHCCPRGGAAQWLCQSQGWWFGGRGEAAETFQQLRGVVPPGMNRESSVRCRGRCFSRAEPPQPPLRTQVIPAELLREANPALPEPAAAAESNNQEFLTLGTELLCLSFCSGTFLSKGRGHRAPQPRPVLPAPAPRFGLEQQALSGVAGSSGKRDRPESGTGLS